MASFLGVVGDLSSISSLIREVIKDINKLRGVAQAYSARQDDLEDLQRRFEKGRLTYEFLLPFVIDLLEQGENNDFLESQKSETEEILLRMGAHLDDWRKRIVSQDKQNASDSIVVIANLDKEKKNLGKLLEELDDCRYHLESSIVVLSARIADKKMERLTAIIIKQNSTPPSTEIDIKNYVERMKKARERPDNSMQLIVKKDIDDWDDIRQCKRLEEDSDLNYGISTRLLRLKGIGKNKYDNCLVNFRPWNDSRDYDEVKKETMTIAKILSSADDNKAIAPDTGSDLSVKDNDTEFGGLIECVGVVQRDRDTRFALLFRLPEELQLNRPISLRRALTEKPTHSLSNRVRLAIGLAQSLFLVHAAGLVHKDVRPESVIITQNEGFSDHKDMYPCRLGVPYLVAFGQARSNNGFTERLSHDDHPNRSLVYRSPRHHPEPADQESDTIKARDGQIRRIRRLEYRMIDDIYGLGVCLLEIGLWRSLFKATGTTYVDDEFFFTVQEGNNIIYLKGKDMQKNLIKIAKQEIPKFMGDKFADVVVRCLDCFHPNNFGQYDKTREESVQQLLASYVSTVLKELRNIKV